MQLVQIYTGDLLKNQERSPNFVAPSEDYGQNQDQRDMKAYWPSKAQSKIIFQKQTVSAFFVHNTGKRQTKKFLFFFKKKLVMNAQHY